MFKSPVYVSAQMPKVVSGGPSNVILQMLGDVMGSA